MESPEVSTQSHTNQINKSAITSNKVSTITYDREEQKSPDIISKIDRVEHNPMGVPSINTLQVDKLNVPSSKSESVTTKRTKFSNVLEVSEYISRPEVELIDQSASDNELSDNIVVCDMSIDVPPSKLPAEVADITGDLLEKILKRLKFIKLTNPADPNDENLIEIRDESVDDLEVISTCKKASSAPSTISKLQQDKAYIYQVLSDVMEELRSKRTFECLKEEVNNVIMENEVNRDLKINHEILREQEDQLRELSDHYEKIRINNRKILPMLLANSAEEIEKITLLSNINLDYIKKWEESRLDQQMLRLEIIEQKLHDKLGDYALIQRVDAIVSTDLRVFLQNDIAKMEEEIDNWTLCYNEDLKRCAEDLDTLVEKINDEREKLSKKFELEEKKKLLEACEASQAAENERQERIHRAAVTIQAFWRGYMVQHQLGQYFRLKEKLRKQKKLIMKKRKRQKQRKKKKQKKLKK